MIKKKATVEVERGITLANEGKLELAIEAFTLALKIDKNAEIAYLWRGKCKSDLDRQEDALKDFDKVPFARSSGFLLPLGACLLRLGQTVKALHAFDHATKLAQDKSGAHINRALALMTLGRLTESFEALNQAILIDPSRPEAYFNLSLLLMMVGEFDAGWELYEWRFKAGQKAFQMPLAKRWDGVESIDGKTLLISLEQGMGDMIQFSRYVMHLRAMNARVLIEVQAALVPLIKRMVQNDPGVQIISISTSQYVAWLDRSGYPHFDFYCPLMSLPHALKAQPDSIPFRGGYMREDLSKVEAWRSKLDALDAQAGHEAGDAGATVRPLRIGLVWAGNIVHQNDRNRSVNLEKEIKNILPLIHLPGTQWHSLQKEKRPADDKIIQKLPLHDWSNSLNDFDDTAALITLMDIVITVDTSVAHLAGALNVPTWMLIPFCPDFRWMHNRNDSPWYESVCLYRQNTPGDWSRPLELLKQDIEQIAQEMGHPAAPVHHTDGAATLIPAQLDPAEVTEAPRDPPAAEEAPFDADPDHPAIACKVCAAPAHYVGAVDFNKNCESIRGLVLPSAGISVHYHSCTKCGLTFTGDMDAWSKEEFQEKIYNDDYVTVDPDYVSIRPAATAETVFEFANNTGLKRLLDYGSGSGVMARILREKGLSCDAWDPMVPSDFTPKPHQYDLVTSFEVFEHTPDPVQTAKDVISFAKKTGVVLFSTLTLDESESLDHWYVGPRNGHITIHTKKSLKMLFQKFGWGIHHFSSGTHLAYRVRPKFLPKN